MQTTQDNSPSKDQKAELLQQMRDLNQPLKDHLEHKRDMQAVQCVDQLLDIAEKIESVDQNRKSFWSGETRAIVPVCLAAQVLLSLADGTNSKFFEQQLSRRVKHLEDVLKTASCGLNHEQRFICHSVTAELIFKSGRESDAREALQELHATIQEGTFARSPLPYGRYPKEQLHKIVSSSQKQLGFDEDIYVPER